MDGPLQGDKFIQRHIDAQIATDEDTLGVCVQTVLLDDRNLVQIQHQPRFPLHHLLPLEGQLNQRGSVRWLPLFHKLSHQRSVSNGSKYTQRVSSFARKPKENDSRYNHVKANEWDSPNFELPVAQGWQHVQQTGVHAVHFSRSCSDHTPQLRRLLHPSSPWSPHVTNVPQQQL